MNTYTNLHVHSFFSVLDGICSPEELVEHQVLAGATALAITDHGTLAGWPDFFIACKDAGIKPILGIEAYMVPNCRVKEVTVSPTKREMRTGYHLVLLAKNMVGYKNIIALNNIAQTEGFYYSPKLDWETLMQHKEGLIVSSACVAGEISQHILAGTDAAAIAKRFKEVFDKDFYLEIQDNYMQSDDQRNVNKGMLALAKKLDIKIVPTNDSHYLREQDQKMHDVAICMQTKKTLNDPDRMSYDGLYHVKLFEEMYKIFGDLLKTTDEIAEKVEGINIFSQSMNLPVMTKEPDAELEKLTLAGVKQLGLFDGPDGVYEKRRRRELDIIFKLKMSGYFLAMRDIIGIIHDINCPVGWARGSAGGSLVCYALGITDLDPIKYNLLFERFVNEYRKDWPDIDIDVPQSRRKEIIQKITERFGEKCVAHISTVAYLKPKVLLKDICRVIGVSVADAMKLTKLVPFESDKVETWERLEPRLAEVKDALDKMKQGQFIWEIMKGLFWVPRHLGVHASGVIVATKPIPDIMPIRREESGKPVVQYTMDHINRFGFLKFDILGLKTLDVIFGAAADAKIDIKKVPLDDPKVYAALAEGRVAGVFQMDDSATAANIGRRMKPTNIEEIALLLALNRPGLTDSGQLEVYLQRRAGMAQPSYLHPSLKEALAEHFGVCVYQEQMMKMAQVYAGYSLDEAEELRKGIGKKDVQIIDKTKKLFAEKATKLGHNPMEIEQVLALIDAAGRYSFNKCLAAGTMVETVQGRVKIEDIKPGDPVYSIHNDGEIVVQPVKAIYENGVRDVYEIILSNGFKIEATKTHKFLTSHGYKAVHELQLGDSLKVLGQNPPSFTVNVALPSVHGSSYCINESNVMSIKWIGRKATYDLEMPIHHNFVANGIISHNSHAVGYAMITYMSSWMSENHPLEFFRHMINLADNDDRQFYISAAMIRGIKIMRPNVNTSDQSVTIEDGKLRLGLFSMKGIGEAAATKIVNGRPFMQIQQLVSRLPKNVVSLLYAVKAVESIPDHATFTPVASSNEIDILGFAVDGIHKQFQDLITYKKAMPIHMMDKNGVGIFRLVDYRETTDKNNGLMAFVTIMDVYGPQLEDVVIFHSIYGDKPNRFKKGDYYVGMFNKGNRGNWLITAIETVDQARFNMLMGNEQGVGTSVT